MRFRLFTAFVLILGFSSAAITADNHLDPAGYVYVNVPFAGGTMSQEDDRAKLGLSIHYRPDPSWYGNNAQVATTELQQIRSPALMEISFHRDGLSSLKSNGVSLLQEDLRLHADGEGFGMIDWLGLVVAGAVGYAIVSAIDDGDSIAPDDTAGNGGGGMGGGVPMCLPEGTTCLGATAALCCSGTCDTSGDLTGLNLTGACTGPP